MYFTWQPYLPAFLKPTSLVPTFPSRGSASPSSSKSLNSALSLNVRVLLQVPSHTRISQAFWVCLPNCFHPTPSPESHSHCWVLTPVDLDRNAYLQRSPAPSTSPWPPTACRTGQTLLPTAQLVTLCPHPNPSRLDDSPPNNPDSSSLAPSITHHSVSCFKAPGKWATWVPQTYFPTSMGYTFTYSFFHVRSIPLLLIRLIL